MPRQCGTQDRYRYGDYRLLNNVWNEPVGAGGRQCIAEPHEQSYAWDWDWPLLGSDVPVSYPAVVLGDKPWEELGSSTPRLPRRLDALQMLDCAYHYELRGGGRRNVAFNFWLTEGAAATRAAIRVEVMIWLEWSHGIQPSGGLIERTPDYELWAGERNDQGLVWTCYSYRLLNAERADNLDLLAWLRRLAQSQHLPPLHLADVEFGTEIWDGRGAMDLRFYSLAVQD